MATPLDFELLLQDARWQAALNRAEQKHAGFTNRVVQQNQQIQNTFDRLGQLAGGAFVFAKLAELPQQIVKVRSEFQQLETSFTALFKSKEKADALLGDVKAYAAVNPSSVLETAQAAKQLLAYGFSAEKIIPTLTKLGDLSAGIGTSMSDLTYLMGTTFTQGRLYVQDFNQFVGRGIPLTKALSETMGVAESEVRGLVEAGRIGFPEVEAAITNLTKKGSIFGGLALEANKSFKGLTSQLGDAFEAALNDIGQQNEGLVNSAITGTIDMVKNYKDVINVLQVLTATYGTYRAAVALALVAQKAYDAGLVVKAESEALAANATRIESLRAEVSALAAKKVALTETAVAQNAAAVAARVELATAQAAQAAGQTLLDVKQKAALADRVAAAQNNLIAAQETAGIGRKQALAASQQFYATRQVLTKTTTAAAAAAETTLTTAQSIREAITRRVTAAQKALNGTMLANPYVLMTTVIVGLAYAYYKLRDEAMEVKSAQELMADSTKDSADKLAKETAEISTQISVLKNKNVADSERQKAYEKLKEIAPSIIGNLTREQAATADLTAQTKLYIEQLSKRIQMEADQEGLVKAIKQRNEAKEAADKAKQAYLAAPGKGGQMVSTGPNAAVDRTLQLQGMAEATAKDFERANGVVDTFMNRINKAAGGDTKDSLEQRLRALDADLSRFPEKDKKLATYKQTYDEAKKLRKQLKDLANEKPADKTFTQRLGEAETAGALQAAKAYADTDAKLDDLAKKVKDKRENAKRGSKERADLEKLEKGIGKAQGKTTAAERQAAKEADKAGAFGSVAYYESIAKKADEVLQKTAAGNKAEIDRQTAIRDNAQAQADAAKLQQETVFGTLGYYEKLAELEQKKLSRIPASDPAAITKQVGVVVAAQDKAEEIRKQTAIKSFADEIEQKKGQYELYQRWVDAYGKDAADAQFADLRKSGDGYVDYLNSKIADLESKKKAGALSEKDAVNLDGLLGRRNELTGVKSPIDLFTESLDRAKVEAGNLTEYLQALEAAQAKLGPTDYEQKIVVSKRIISAKDERVDALRGYLQSVAGSEAQAAAITKQYADLRTQLREKEGKVSAATYEEMLSAVNKGEQQELDEARLTRLKNSDEWKAYTAAIISEGRRAQSETVNQLRGRLALLKKDGLQATDEYKDVLASLRKAESDQAKNPLVDLQKFAGYAGELGQALSGLGGNLGEVGDLFSELATQVGFVSRAFEKGLDDVDKYQLAAQGLVNIVSSISSAAADRKRAEMEYNTSLIDQQRELNLLLNDQVAINAKAKSRDSIFGRDFEAEIAGGFEQMRDAQAKYQAAISKLNEGQVKGGLKDKIDGKTALKQIGAAAGTGAALGSAIPGVGTVIGGLVGAGIGAIGALFGSATKKEAEFVGLMEKYPDLVQQGVNGQRVINTELAKSLLNSGQLSDSTKALVADTLAWQEQIKKADEAINSALSTLVGGLGDTLRDKLVGAFADGTLAAGTFGDAVADILQNMLSQIIFQEVFGEQLKGLKDRLKASLDTKNGGDGDMIDDLGDFFKDAAKLRQQYEDLMTGSQQQAKQYGLDIFKPKKEKDSNSLSGSITQVSEQTASVLAGQITGIRISQAKTNQAMDRSLILLAGIETNTGLTVQELKRVYDKLDSMSKADPIRSGGGF